MSSFDDISTLYAIESEKLSNMITIADTKSDLSITQIIEMYYQIINVSSMITILKPQIHGGNQKILLDKILETEKIISNKFNSEIHPQIMDHLEKSIQETTRILQTGSGQKTKEYIENQAKLYEELRQKMSTKEFVGQYAKGLSND